VVEGYGSMIRHVGAEMEGTTYFLIKEGAKVDIAIANLLSREHGDMIHYQKYKYKYK